MSYLNAHRNLSLKQEVVLVNMKIAYLDAIPGFDYFRPDYNRIENAIDKRLSAEVEAFEPEVVDYFYQSLCDGYEIEYVSQEQDFRIIQ
jgi:hypothetical protein